MKIKILSDGTARTTRVVNAETGEVIDGCYSVKWKVDTDSRISTAILAFRNIPVDIMASGDDITEFDDTFRKYKVNDNILWNHILR